MPVRIAEYLGTRIDTELPIHPVAILPEEERLQSPICPFDNQPCMKMRAKLAYPPVCALRKPTGQYYIVCENRLISTNVGRISRHQKDMLLLAGQQLFNPDIQPWQLGYKAEVRIRTRDLGKGSHNADFILAVTDTNLETYGPRRILTEVQGGGETSGTGSIGRHINAWAADANRTNDLLRQMVKKPGTIETNAWRRLQEQLFAKATTAKITGYGFAVLLGEVVFDYMWNMIPDLASIRVKPTEPWDVAFVVYKEKALEAGQPIIGNIELIIDTEKTFYTQLNNLFAQMTQRGRNSPEAFTGKFITLSDELVDIDGEYLS